MLKLINNSVTPPDKMRYRFPEDGFTVMAMDRDDWFRGIKKHYVDNEYPMPDDWRERAEAQLCATLPSGWCRHEDGSEPTAFLSRRFSLGDAINGTKVLANLVANGCPIVSQEVAEERARTCAACYVLMEIPGCGSCGGIANIVAAACGARTTSSDHVLEGRVCAACHCAARANVWIPVEISQVGVTPEALALMPSEWCWKKREIEAL